MKTKMTIALILAGGNDPYFQSHVPKQFCLVDDLPLFVYTLTTFQEHNEIDEIYFICLDGWQAMVESYCQQFNISKMKKIISAGASGQDSAYRGVCTIGEECHEESIVVIHDAIRPLVDSELISDSIKTCREFGMGIAAIGSMDAFMRTHDRKTGYEAIGRYKLLRIQTPQSYHLGNLLDYFSQANEQGVREHMDVCTMVSALGHEINFSKGSEYNLKINRFEDIDLFKTLKDKRMLEKE